MAKAANQKLKILYLKKILLEKTDENHSITMAEIIASLQAYGVSAERKSIYDDIESLWQYGMDIIGEQKNRRLCKQIRAFPAAAPITRLLFSISSGM